MRPGSPTVAEVQQYVDAIPVADARWTLRLRPCGHLTQVTGAPFDPARLTAARRPPISAEEAVRLATHGVSDDDVEATATLAIEGRTDRLVWTVELKGIEAAIALRRRRGRRARSAP